MSHCHHHHHHHGNEKNLLISIVLNVLITVGQILGGLMAGSLALISDAVHNFSDVVSLVISYIASKASKQQASVLKTFGNKRAEILAAFINASSLMVVAVLLVVEAVKRIQQPEPIEANIVIWLALLGVLFNGFSVLLLQKNSKHNMNIRSAYLHLVSDMLASVAVMLGGILIKYFEIYWIDSLLTLGIALYLIVMGFDLLKSSFKVLMLYTPEDLEIEAIVKDVESLDCVTNMHHVHAWQLNEHEIHLEAHIDFDKDIRLSEFDDILKLIEDRLKQKFSINHVNIQPEFGKCDDKDVIVQD